MLEISYKFIAIEGNIGAGKTTLAMEISKSTGGKLLLERFEENPYLKDFYQDREKHALQTEQFFLEDRIHHLIDFFRDQPQLVIADFSIHKSIVFSNLTLTEANRKEFRKVFENGIPSIVMPDLIIHLKNDPLEMKKRILRRGREYEQTIEKGYLEDLESEYETYWSRKTGLNVLQINMSDFTFPYLKEEISKLVDYLKVTEIKGFKRIGKKDLG